MASSLERTLLPFDLVEEILCRIPVEYLIRLQLVCKQWYSLFKNKRFIYRYFDLAQERFIRIHRMVQIFNPVTQTRLISRLPDELRDFLPNFTFIHCDGLLLLKFNYATITFDCELAIWNPILGQIKWIQSNVIPYLNNDTYGFGYGNVSRDDYKVLRFCEGIFDPENKDKECYKVTFEIYGMKSNSWSIVDTSCDWTPDPLCKGVSVNGNMYWMAHRNTDTNMFIQSFDFSTETFKPKSCLPFECYTCDAIALSCFRKDKLSLLHQFGETKKIEIWVTNKVDNEVMSWCKYLSFASPDMPALHAYRHLTLHPADPEHFIDKNDKIRVCCEEKIEDESEDESVCVSVYEIGKDGIKKEEEREGYEAPFIPCYVYVPSLVPLHE